MPKQTYITTPIYYVNSVPHIGTTLTTLVADMCMRYERMRGNEATYLTGTDENGPKVMEAAIKSGRDPMEFVTEISDRFRETFTAMNMQYDRFVRTTDEHHKRAVHLFFNTLRERGHVYEGTYEGWYDVSSETFYKEADIVDGKSPDGNPVQWVSEKNWFFRLSAFGDQLLEHIEANPKFLLPESRRNEVVAYIKQGLRDMAISRKISGWGIPVPGEEEQVFYVWFDALISYISGTGWPDNGWEALWPAEIHWMAKEIFTRFHATFWPAMLMAMDLPLPKTIIAHGWFVFGDQKMSKSLGNIIAPLELVEEIKAKTGAEHAMAVDAVRFSLARLLPYDGDTNYTRAEVDKHYNSDLANDLGNALNRSLSMAHKFAGGVVPEAPIESEMVAAVRTAVTDFDAAMDILHIDHATEAALGLVRFLNKYIDTRAPWALAKSEDPALGGVLRSMLFALRAAEGMLRPIMPWAADAIAQQLGLPPLVRWSDIGTEGTIPGGTQLGTPTPLFPRIDPKKQEAMETPAAPAAPVDAAPIEQTAEPITIQDFMKVQLRVGRVLEAETLEKSDKLVKLQVLIGTEKRQILAGIRKSYNPLDLVGRQVIVVANLKPAKLMGHESQGMILAADGPDGQAILLQPEQEAPEGTSVH
ncbi:MAG: methionine--tRNA ligase [Chthonomonas sp.]|nr:methionine--tRNA ligase [Chthonomonas sp.]